MKHPHPDSLPQGEGEELSAARRTPRPEAGSAGLIATRSYTFGSREKPLGLESGARLGPITLAYETYGELAADGGNAILVLHALSGDAHAAGWSADADAPSAVDGVGADEKGIQARGGLGWWDGMIGPGKAFDTRKYFVISSNIIGGCRGSTGPTSTEPHTRRPYGSSFPVVTVGDMVNAQRELLRHLGVERLLAVTGGSLGGNQALQWAVAYPGMVLGCIPIASSARLTAQGIAFNEIGRQAIMSDPDWRGGDYYDGSPPARGLAIARMIGHVTYLSEASMQAKFGRRRRNRDKYGYDYSTDFEVESYLRHQGATFVDRFDANSYLLITKAIDYFDLAAAFGGGSLERALHGAQASFLVISFSSDWLYPPHQSDEIVSALKTNNADVRYYNLRSSYGHDAFLLEEVRQTKLIRAFLSRLRERTRTIVLPTMSCRRAVENERGLPDHHGHNGDADGLPRAFGFDTRAIHAGQRPDPYTGARAMPLYQTTSFVFESPDHAASLFELQEYGNIYSRIGNPTTAAFEERMASLEGGAGGVATASGQAAQFLTFFTMLAPGDHIVAARTLYGGTFTQFEHSFKKMGIGVTFVDPDQPENFAGAITPRTRALYGEIIGNPSGNVLDIEAVAAIAHAAEIPLVVDNTFPSPYLCRPIEWGADVVVHSATKFIGGHGTSIAGVVVESGKFNWSNGKFDTVALPSPAYHGLAFHETFGPYGYLMKLRAESLRDVGACLSPFNAFLLLLGLETLPLRMERHCANALAVARMLEAHTAVSWVRYAGLPSSPHFSLAQKYLPRGASAVFTFGIEGGRAAGKAFIEKLELVSHLANVGDAKSLVIHPASTTHQQMSDADLLAAGIGPEMIRLSVGLEDLDDIIWDMDRALRASQRVSQPVGVSG